jgi:hypothetical protein
VDLRRHHHGAQFAHLFVIIGDVDIDIAYTKPHVHHTFALKYNRVIITYAGEKCNIKLFEKFFCV